LDTKLSQTILEVRTHIKKKIEAKNIHGRFGVVCDHGLHAHFNCKKSLVVVHHFSRNPTLRECEDETHTPEMGTWEFSGTPETLEFDCRGQNTSH